MLTIERLDVLAQLDDPSDPLWLASAEAAAGDESWEQWVREYEQGDALILRLTVTLVAAEGEPEVIELSNRGVFVEAHVHPPRVEQQVAELIGKDFGALTTELERRGHALPPYTLEEMYVHVQLGADVKAALAQAAASRSRH